MGRKILLKKETVFSLMPFVAPGISISELHFKLPGTSKTAVRNRVRELLSAEAVHRTAAAEIGGTPRYYRTAP